MNYTEGSMWRKMMKVKLFALILLLVPALVYAEERVDCSQFSSDIRSGVVHYNYKISKDLYLPPALCGQFKETLGKQEGKKNELYSEYVFIETCGATKEEALKTTLVCQKQEDIIQVTAKCQYKDQEITPCVGAKLTADLFTVTKPSVE